MPALEYRFGECRAEKYRTFWTLYDPWSKSLGEIVLISKANWQGSLRKPGGVNRIKGSPLKAVAIEMCSNR